MCFCQELILVFYMQSSTWVVRTGVSVMHRSRTRDPESSGSGTE